MIVYSGLKSEFRSWENSLEHMYKVLNDDAQESIDRIRKFTEDCDWDQFHSPANFEK